MQKLLTDLKSFYKTQGRYGLPWRQTHDPYKILVSEIMLQQTQVARVLPKYEAFIKKFPTAKNLQPRLFWKYSNSGVVWAITAEESFYTKLHSNLRL